MVSEATGTSTGAAAASEETLSLTGAVSTTALVFLVRGALVEAGTDAETGASCFSAEVFEALTMF